MLVIGGACSPGSQAKVLTLLLGQIQYTVMNSTKFVGSLQNVCTRSEEHLVSFDITSLFTQEPINEALEVVKERLTRDPTLMDRTTISVPQLADLIELCLRSTYFQFQNEVFEQIDMAHPWAPPQSPVIASLFMEDLEEKAMQTSALQPSLWLTYVDNTFVIWPHGEVNLQSFHAHLNQFSANIQFTIEREKAWHSWMCWGHTV